MSDLQMDDGFNNAKRLDLLISEYNRVTGKIHNMNNSFLALQGIPFAGIFVAFGLFSNFSKLAILLPFFLFYFSYNVAKYTLEIFEQAGYASFLEDKINNYFPDKVLLQESVIKSKLRNNNFTGGILQVPFVVPIHISSLYFYCVEAKKISETNICNLIIIIIVSIFLFFSVLAFIYHIGILWKAKDNTKSSIYAYIAKSEIVENFTESPKQNT
jgi:hypothetical protein